MTNKKPHIVKIKGKGTDGMGVTEDLARQMCTSTNKGKRYMAVVEVMVDVIHDGLAQKISDLTIEQFWPATDDNLDEHLRELTRVLHQNKALASEDDDPIDGIDGDGPAPKVADVLADGAKHRPHPFLPVDAADDNGICDVCGQVDDVPVHADLRKIADPFGIGETAEDEADPDIDDEPANPDDPAYDTHEYVPDADGNCDDCGQAKDAAVHNTADIDEEAPVPA